MDEPIKKRVDESWKEQAEREKLKPSQAPASPPGQLGQPAAAEAHEHGEEAQSGEARFDLFVSSLAMEAFIALGDIPHPVTRKQTVNLQQAKYLIDLIGILEAKTKGNLSVDEERLVKDALYQLRMRYMAKAGTG